MVPIFKIALLSMAFIGYLYSASCAADRAENGRALFHDTKAFQGIGEKACSTCHPNGKGLRTFDFSGNQRSRIGIRHVKEAIIICIQIGLRGKPIPPESAQMKDLIAYIQVLTRDKDTESP